MARLLHQLKQKQVENEKRPGRYADGGGLYLQVQESVGRGVTKSWLFRYQRAGVAREMGLGPLHTVGLADARDRAQEARRRLLDGHDPIAVREAQKAGLRLAEENSKTFKQCAESYVTANARTWRNRKHAGQWSSTLETYAYPVIGNLNIAVVDTPLVLRILEPIWEAKNETASRLRGRLENILAWAKVRGYRSGDNPARWRGHLDQTLPKISRIARIEHHPALPFDEAPPFLKLLRTQEGVAPRALEFLILTAARTGEVIGASWSEIDVQAGVWTIPAERMKGRREHRVPLVPRALQILEEARALDGDFVFPGRDPRRPLSNMAMLKVLERMKRDDITAHGFRSSFRDWAAERTTFQPDVVEMALAHAIGDKVEAAYRRGTLFEKRRKLMEAWSQFCEKPSGTVIALHQERQRAISGQ